MPRFSHLPHLASKATLVVCNELVKEAGPGAPCTAAWEWRPSVQGSHPGNAAQLCAGEEGDRPHASAPVVCCESPWILSFYLYANALHV